MANQKQSARQRLHPLMREFGENNGTLYTCLGMAVVVAFIWSRVPRIWVLALPPALGPLVTAAYLWLSPLNPYKIEHRNISHDAMAQKLIALLGSNGARRYCLRVAIALSGALTGCTVFMARLQKPIIFSFDRSQDVRWLLGGTFLFAATSLGSQMCFLLRWAFPRWEQTEDSSCRPIH